ncbi:MAG: PAS domain-containing protein, partial [Bacteroidota bacterium]
KMVKKIISILLYFLSFIIIEFVIVNSLYNNYTNKKEQYLSKMTNELQIAYSVIINSYNKLSQTIFDESINRPEVLDIFKDSYNTDESTRSEAREKLYRLLNPSYQNFNKKSSVFLHFQLPDCTSFLRFYNPGLYGDNLSTLRYTLKVANEKKIITQGFEIGSVYHGYRFVYPMFYNDVHIGSAEIGISYEAIKKEMEKVFPSSFKFIINKEIAEKTLSVNNLKEFAICNLSDDYLEEKNPVDSNNNLTEIEKINALERNIKKDVSPKLSTNDSFSEGAKFSDENYILSIIPVFNFEGVKIAYIISYTIDNTLYEYYYDFCEKLILFSFLLLAIILFIRYASHTIRIMKQNRDFLQSVTDNMTEGLIVLNKNLKIISINQIAEKMLDLNNHEIKGRSLTNIIDCKDEDGNILSPENWPIFANINYGFTYKSKDEFFVINKSQREIPLELSAAPHYQKTDLVGFIIVCRINNSNN